MNEQVYKKCMERIAEVRKELEEDPSKALGMLVKAGIMTKDGKYTEHYQQSEEEIAEIRDLKFFDAITALEEATEGMKIEDLEILIKANKSSKSIGLIKECAKLRSK